MKPYLFSIVLIFSLCCRAQNSNRQNAVFSPIETIITDLNADTINDTIALYQTPVEGDPGIFTKMNVSVNGRRMTFHAKDAWDAVDDSFAKANNNAVQSKNAFVYKENEQSFIVLFGYPYPSSREEILILRVNSRNMDIVFHNAIEEPLKIADINNDGHAELITQAVPEYYKATENGFIGTYSPYIVYTLSPGFAIDKTLTEKYNREHYIWEGMKYNDQIKVYYPNDGSKPKLLKP